MNKKYTVVAAFQARSGKEAALREALVKLLVPTRGEEGCLNYDLHESLEAPGKFLFYENWSSPEAHQKHMDSVHIKELAERLEELCANAPEITFWKELL
ncbi:MAG: putative quinol monooxygenase [Chthoniobacterales bacterium]